MGAHPALGRTALNRDSGAAIEIDHPSFFVNEAASNRTAVPYDVNLIILGRTPPPLAVKLGTLWATWARLTPSHAAALRLPHHGACSHGSAEGIEASLHRFAEKQVIPRRDVKDQFVVLAG